VRDDDATPPTSALGHNGGPPLDEHVPEWGTAPIPVYFAWKAAHRRAWRPVPREIALMRQARAEALGLTYGEYTAELMDTGRWLGPGDAARIAAIKQRRR
jgi:hypothetical protein